METFKTLSEFIEEQVTKFNLTDTKETEKKLRVKFTRELKELNLWENAKKIHNGKVYTRVFTEDDLKKLSESVEKYLVKQSPIDYATYMEFKESSKKHIEFMRNYTYEDMENDISSSIYDKPAITKEEKMEVMITALFEKYFTPLDMDLWERDDSIIHYTDINDTATMETAEYISANLRIRDPKKRAYYKEKKTL